MLKVAVVAGLDAESVWVFRRKKCEIFISILYNFFKNNDYFSRNQKIAGLTDGKDYK